MVKFPTPEEVRGMQEKDQQGVVELVDRLIAALRIPLTQSRPDASGLLKVEIPRGFLKPNERWDMLHRQELDRRIVESGWTTGHHWFDERMERHSYIVIYFPPKP